MPQRLFTCARCGTLVSVCSSCDKRRMYCSKRCATEARKESVRRCARRYQQTKRGAANHAERQRRYRYRRSAGVTHHTRQIKPTSEQARVLPWAPALLIAWAAHSSAAGHRPKPDVVPCSRCVVCGEPGEGLLHTTFLRAGWDPG